MPNWRDVLNEINAAVVTKGAAFDLVRRKYLAKLSAHTDRNVIAYYSGWLAKPNVVGRSVEINDEDKNGFMMAVHRLDRKRGLDLLLHTPGGNISSTHSLIDYLRKMFGKDIRAVIPQIAMSAGTVVACSCKEILMARHSNLGPIDPQMAGIAAAGVKEEFEKAIAEIKADPARRAVWREIIAQYRPTFLSTCENAVQWSKDFVREQLERVMFADERDAKEKATRITDALSDFSGNKSHSRHIHADECQSLGLRVSMLEDDQVLQDLVLTVHHCYMHQLTNSSSIKVIENHLGVAMIKQLEVQAVQVLK